MELQEARRQLKEAWDRFDRQEDEPQTQGNSTGAFSVSYWTKVVELIEQGVSIPKGVSTRQITDTPIDLIKLGYVFCCDLNNPSGYRSLIKVEFFD